jgi:putative transposase
MKNSKTIVRTLRGRDRQLEMAWPACGLPELLHLDNAPEFKSEAPERGTREYGINLLYRPIGRPHFGGLVERLIGTVMGAVHLLPAPPSPV